MQKCTDFLATLALLLTLVLIMAAIPTEKEGAIYDDTVRLHILARSDSSEDQKLKLTVRDKLLSKYGAVLDELGSKAEAEEKITAMLSDIKRDVDGWIADAGYDYESRVSLGEEWYERREYGSIALPEGRYTSLKVELGEAEGQNWWCVMYPPHCLDIATEGAPADDALRSYTKEEKALVGRGKYTVKFKLLELTSGIFASRR